MNSINYLIRKDHPGKETIYLSRFFIRRGSYRHNEWTKERVERVKGNSETPTQTFIGHSLSLSCGAFSHPSTHSSRPFHPVSPILTHFYEFHLCPYLRFSNHQM